MEARCLVCNSVGAPYAIKNQCSMHRCPKCQLIFVSPMPDNTLRVYEGDYFTGATQGFGYTDYDADKQPMVPAFKTYLRRIARYSPPAPNKRMLDVGAATGFFLNLAREDGWTTMAGVEPSATAAETARRKKLDVRTGILEPGLYEPASFDVITLWDVIEHVPDPKGMINLAVSYLKPGGVIAINTPDASSLCARILGVRWHALCPPEHLCLFGAPALDELLQQTRLRLLEHGKIGKSFTLQYIAKTLAYTRKKSRLFKWMARVLHGSTLGGLEIPLNLRDNIFVLAQKPE